MSTSSVQRGVAQMNAVFVLIWVMAIISSSHAAQLKSTQPGIKHHASVDLFLDEMTPVSPKKQHTIGQQVLDSLIHAQSSVNDDNQNQSSATLNTAPTRTPTATPTFAPSLTPSLTRTLNKTVTNVTNDHVSRARVGGREEESWISLHMRMVVVLSTAGSLFVLGLVFVLCYLRGARFQGAAPSDVKVERPWPPAGVSLAKRHSIAMVDDSREVLEEGLLKVKDVCADVCAELTNLDQLALTIRPMVAVLALPDAFLPPEAMEIAAKATVKYQDSDRELFIVRLKPGWRVPQIEGSSEDGGGKVSRRVVGSVVLDEALLADVRSSNLPPCVQNRVLSSLLHSDECKEARADNGPWIWPIHQQEVCQAITAAEFNGHARNEAEPLWQRLLVAMRLWRYDEGDEFVHAIREQMCHGSAYMFAWDRLFCLLLWPLAVLSIAMCVGGVAPDNETGHLNGAKPLNTTTWNEKTVEDAKIKRYLWEGAKGLMYAWTLFVAVYSFKKSTVVKGEKCRNDDGVSGFVVPNPKHNAHHGPFRTFVMMTFVALPAMLLFFAVVFAAFSLWIQEVLHITYVWGDCIKLGCMSAQEKHGILGWLAEVGMDILLAIVFEILLAICGPFSRLLISFRNYEDLQDVKIGTSLLQIFIEAFDRIAVYAVLAFYFVPPVTGDPCLVQESGKPNLNCDCSDIFLIHIFGEGDIRCLQRRLPIADRRVRFEQALTGPFIVSPFISILMGAIVPQVAVAWHRFAERVGCCATPFTAMHRGLTRILGLIFAYSLDPQFIVRGWPFTAMEVVPLTEHNAPKVEPKSDADSHIHPKEIFDADGQCQIINDALQQAGRKVYDVSSELLQLKMNFLLVSCFAPVNPAGVGTTLAAWWLEGRFDLVKMLYNRQRAWPMSDDVLHRAHVIWSMCVCVLAAFFSYGLSLVTYNDDPGVHTAIVWYVIAGSCAIGYVIWEGALVHCAIMGWLHPHK